MKNIIIALAEEPHWLITDDGDDLEEFYCESCAIALAAELGYTATCALPVGCYAPEVGSQLYCERCGDVPLNCSIIEHEDN